MARVRKNRSGDKPSDTRQKLGEAANMCRSFGGIFGKFGGLIEMLGDLAEKGEEFSKTGEFKGLDPEGKLRGVYGVSIKTGLRPDGEQELKVEPFGNVHRQPTGKTVVEETQEPLVDVHEEEDHVLVIAEIPGVSKKDVELALSGDRLTLEATRGAKHYQKEVLLPGSFSEDNMRWNCKNGILTIRLERP
jgi:HSP20 family protein